MIVMNVEAAAASGTRVIVTTVASPPAAKPAISVATAAGHSHTGAVVYHFTTLLAKTLDTASACLATLARITGPAAAGPMWTDTGVASLERAAIDEHALITCTLACLRIT